MENNREAGSFVNGFMLGIAAGVIGYVAFGTKRGTEIRKRLQAEWLAAKESVSNSDADGAVVETAQSVFGQIKHVLKQTLSSFDGLGATAEEKNHKKHNKVKNQKTSKPKKFTGL